MQKRLIFYLQLSTGNKAMKTGGLCKMFRKCQGTKRAGTEAGKKEGKGEKGEKEERKRRFRNVLVFFFFFFFFF
jgi:hypothetical protein